MDAAPHAKHRYLVLDAIRGAAALCVMVHHYTQYDRMGWLDGAWVAVDIFFILSGFVLMHSYGQRILADLSLAKFLSFRASRLAPFYIVGLLLGLASDLILIEHHHAGEIALRDVVVAAVLNAVMLPDFHGKTWPFGADAVTGPLFPLNDPAWSLFFEALVNVGFWVFFAVFRGVRLKWLLATSFAVFLGSSVYYHVSNPGGDAGTFLLGFPRVIYEFFLGVLIHQVMKSKATEPRPRSFCLVAAAMLICFTFPHSGKLGVLSSVAFAPLLVYFGASLKAPAGAAARAWCEWLGNVSYPLYVIHFPIYMLLIEEPPFEHLAPVLSLPLIAVVTVLASVALVHLDRFARNGLALRARAAGSA